MDAAAEVKNIRIILQDTEIWAMNSNLKILKYNSVSSKLTNLMLK